MKTPPVHLATLLGAFARTRWGKHFGSRDELLAWQQRRVQAFVDGPLRRAPFYARLAAAAVAQLPVMDKATMLANFADCNTAGIELATATAVALRAEHERDFAPTLGAGISVGMSSGTSGARSLFLVSLRERSLWAGTILARTLSAPLLRRLLNPFAAPLRVAFFLRANSNLYASVQSRRLRLRYFDLVDALPTHVPALEELQPDVLVAPSSVLRALADAQTAGELAIAPSIVLAVAEVLEADDSLAIERAFGRAPGQIYQCTEGLLGQTCAHGSLHLAEEHVHFEPEWLDAQRTRFVPRLTDFTRTTQVFARFRLDDVLRLDPRPCPCGRHTLRLAAIEGRQDDVLWLPTLGGGAAQPWFPDQVRRAVLLAQQHFADYALEQQPGRLLVRLREPGSGAAAALQRELTAASATAGLQLPPLHFDAWQPAPPAAKRRRIRGLPRRAVCGQEASA